MSSTSTKNPSAHFHDRYISGVPVVEKQAKPAVPSLEYGLLQRSYTFTCSLLLMMDTAGWTSCQYPEGV